jgi:hypothetical protein
MNLLSEQELPQGFRYSYQFLRLVELGIVNLEPWYMLDGDRLRKRYQGLQERYSPRQLVPFAARGDNDDLACWDGAEERVHLVHDYASRGWEERKTYGDVYGWLRDAIEDLILYDR